MENDEEVSLISFVINFSRQMAYFSEPLSTHQLRVALIARELADLCRLNKEDQMDLMLAALVHDVGAITDEDKRKVLNDLDSYASNHALMGSHILRQAGFDKIATLVAHHHDGAEVLEALDSKMRHLAELLQLADVLDRYRGKMLKPTEAEVDLKKYLSSLETNLSSAQNCEMILEVMHSSAFVKMLDTTHLHDELGRIASTERGINYSTSMITLSKVIMTLVDMKSEHTCWHSWRVARAAYAIANKLGLDEAACKELLIAGNFHDLGKLAVPSRILDKPGALDQEEFAIMKNHVKITHDFLVSMGFNRLAQIAGQHHERMDGSGYPFSLKKQDLSLESRIMAVADVFGALVEDRPYRKALDDQLIKREFKRLSDLGKIDQEIVNVVEHSYDAIKAYVNYRSDDFNKPLVHTAAAFK